MFILDTPPPISPWEPDSGATAFLVVLSYWCTWLGVSSYVEATAIFRDYWRPLPLPLAPACYSANFHDLIRNDAVCYCTPPSHRLLCYLAFTAIKRLVLDSVSSRLGDYDVMPYRRVLLYGLLWMGALSKSTLAVCGALWCFMWCTA